MNDMESAEFAWAISSLERLAACGDYHGELLAIVQRIALLGSLREEDADWLSAKVIPVNVQGGVNPLGGIVECYSRHYFELLDGEHEYAERRDALLRLLPTRIGDPRERDMSSPTYQRDPRARDRDVALATEVLEALGSIRLIQMIVDWAVDNRHTADSDDDFGLATDLTGFVTANPVHANVPIDLRRDEFDFMPFYSEDPRARFRTKRNRFARSNAAKFQHSFARACFHFDRHVAALETLPKHLRSPDIEEKNPRLWEKRPHQDGPGATVDPHYLHSVMQPTTPKKKLPKHAGSKMSPEEAGAARIVRKRVKKKAAKRKRSKKR